MNDINLELQLLLTMFDRMIWVSRRVQAVQRYVGESQRYLQWVLQRDQHTDCF